MGYLAVKGAEEAILAARSLAGPTGGRQAVTAVAEHLPLVVDEIQAEAGVYEPGLAAIAFTQARGDLAEAVFLLRGYRSTLPRRALRFPATRSARRQALAGGQPGRMAAVAYANLRGYGPFHPTLVELRVGALPLTVDHPRTGRPVRVGTLPVTEAEAVGQRPTREGGTLGVGYGCVPGRGERKAVAMAVLDAGLAGVNDDAPFTSPLQDEEFVLAHVDGVGAAGFVEHMKLPHEVSFAYDLDRVPAIRQNAVGP